MRPYLSSTQVPGQQIMVDGMVTAGLPAPQTGAPPTAPQRPAPVELAMPVPSAPPPGAGVGVLATALADHSAQAPAQGLPIAPPVAGPLPVVSPTVGTPPSVHSTASGAASTAASSAALLSPFTPAAAKPTIRIQIPIDEGFLGQFSDRQPIISLNPIMINGRRVDVNVTTVMGPSSAVGAVAAHPTTGVEASSILIYVNPVELRAPGASHAFIMALGDQPLQIELLYRAPIAGVAPVAPAAGTRYRNSICCVGDCFCCYHNGNLYYRDPHHTIIIMDWDGGNRRHSERDHTNCCADCGSILCVCPDLNCCDGVAQTMRGWRAGMMECDPCTPLGRGFTIATDSIGNCCTGTGALLREGAGGVGHCCEGTAAVLRTGGAGCGRLFEGAQNVGGECLTGVGRAAGGIGECCGGVATAARGVGEVIGGAGECIAGLCQCCGELATAFPH
ncbi:MAG TPA: hypothetical protein VJB02_02520 [Coxiellaceae bacterium]|nr:hypothetical protein [Coxiellaceae bacterium]